jgi:hypothetical protein
MDNAPPTERFRTTKTSAAGETETVVVFGVVCWMVKVASLDTTICQTPPNAAAGPAPPLVSLS